MHSKASRLWVYNLALVAVTAGLAWLAPPWSGQWPEPMFVVGFAALQLLVWHYGFPVPSMGMLSMERIPQVAVMCLFPLPVAAMMNALPALVWPFINSRYRQGSLHYGLIRAIHNACMLWLMTAAAAWLYLRLGGQLPLRALDWQSTLALLVAAVAMQLVNSGLMAAFFQIDGRDVRRILTLTYLTVDELFVPIGVLTALIYSTADRLTFTLYMGFLVLTVLSLHRVVQARDQDQARLQALDAASRARQAVSGTQRLDHLGERLLSRIGAMLRFETAFIALLDSERGEFDVVLEIFNGVRKPRYRTPSSRGLTGYVVARAKPLLIDDWSNADPALRARAVVDPDERPGCILMVPICQNDKVLGIVSVQHSHAGQYSETDKHALMAIAEDLAPVIADALTFEELDAYRERLEVLVHERTAELERTVAERESLLAELQAKSELLGRQSREDALTGLANRRHFDERYASELERADRYQHPLSLVLIDIDHFKRVNDVAGHAVGDLVLARVAAVMLGHLRASDLLARIGGEEFAVLLPDTALDGAQRSAEYLRETIAATDFSDLHAAVKVTLSAGVVQWRNGEHRDSLLIRADRLLYAAKAGGRNKVIGEKDIRASQVKRVVDR